MIVVISGASHTGKTLLAQKLLERYGMPYLSIDHLKMGLIRSGNTGLTPCSPRQALTDYLWPIVREMMKTAMENGQNLIVEGCYLPYDLQKDFTPGEWRQIKPLWLIFSQRYLERHFSDIVRYASVIEQRLPDPDFTPEGLAAASRRDLEACVRHGLPYHLIEEPYEVELEL